MIATRESMVPDMTIITWLLDSVGKRYASTAEPIMVRGAKRGIAGPPLWSSSSDDATCSSKVDIRENDEHQKVEP